MNNHGTRQNVMSVKWGLNQRLRRVQEGKTRSIRGAGKGLGHWRETWRMNRTLMSGWGGAAFRGQEHGRHRGAPEGKGREAQSGQRGWVCHGRRGSRERWLESRWHWWWKTLLSTHRRPSHSRCLWVLATTGSPVSFIIRLVWEIGL